VQTYRGRVGRWRSRFSRSAQTCALGWRRGGSRSRRAQKLSLAQKAMNRFEAEDLQANQKRTQLQRSLRDFTKNCMTHSEQTWNGNLFNVMKC